MPDDAQQLPTLSEDDQVALRHWVCEQDIGTRLTDVEPLPGGTQNIVMRLRVDGRAMVLRRPAVHPRPTSDKAMLREIAALRTLAGTPVPHPGVIASCDDLNVLGGCSISWKRSTVSIPATRSPSLTSGERCWPLESNTITAGARLAELGGLASRDELLDAYLAAGGRKTSRLE